MKFGKVFVNKSLNGILAHSMVIDGKKLNKGKIINKTDISLFKRHDIKEITCAILNKKDIQEDKAANAIAKNFRNSSVAVENAITGRSNILAAKSGLLIINEAQINKFNNISEDITIASLNNYFKVEKGDMIATIKIISFSITSSNLKRISNLNLKNALKILPFNKNRCGLILTQGSKENKKLNDISESRIRDRLEKINHELVTTLKCKHNAVEISNKIKLFKKNKIDLILILGASAIVDIKDEIPSAIKQSGGKIIRFGMPVDPGNLLLIGKNKNTHIIGLPGCARSPSLNGFDWVLERIAADVNINKKDIARMGIGGLLKTKKALRNLKTNNNYKISSIILAAGRSKRMKSNNKLLSKLSETTMINQVVNSAILSNTDSDIIVLGHEKENIEKILPNKNLTISINKNYNQGISSSIKIGISSLPEDCDAVIIILGDMPDVTDKLINNLIKSFNPEIKRHIILPYYKSQLGNPVIISRRFFPEILQLKGDSGAKNIIKKNLDYVYKLPQKNNASLLDIDTDQQLITYLSKPKFIKEI